jgi:hypothetical protein
MPTLPAWITPAQFDALRALVAWLDAEGIPYALSGGLAGNLYGSTWPLVDIDLDVPTAALPRLAAHHAPHVTFGPARYADDEFELTLCTVALPAVSIDASGAESIGLRAPDGTVQPWATDLREVVVRPLAGLSLRVVPLDRLVAYKRVIGRTRDLVELERLGQG